MPSPARDLAWGLFAQPPLREEVRGVRRERARAAAMRGRGNARVGRLLRDKVANVGGALGQCGLRPLLGPAHSLTHRALRECPFRTRRGTLGGGKFRF